MAVASLVGALTVAWLLMLPQDHAAIVTLSPALDGLMGLLEQWAATRWDDLAVAGVVYLVTAGLVLTVLTAAAAILRLARRPKYAR